MSSESSIMQPMPEMWTDAWVVRASDLTKALRGPGFEAVKGGRDVLQFLYIFYFSRIQKKTIRKRGKKRGKKITLSI